MPAGFSHSAPPWGSPESGMMPASPQYPTSSYAREERRSKEWSMKQQQGRPAMMGAQLQGSDLQPTQGAPQGWQATQGWQGQLAPNLMPMTGPDAQSTSGSQNMAPMQGGLPGGPFPHGGNMQNMQNMHGGPNDMGGNMQNMQSMQERQHAPHGGPINMLGGNLQHMQNLPPQMQGGPNMRGGNIQGMQTVQDGLNNMRGGNMQNAQNMQHMVPPMQTGPSSMQNMQTMQNVHNMAPPMQSGPSNVQNMQNMQGGEMHGGRMPMQNMMGMQGGPMPQDLPGAYRNEILPSPMGGASDLVNMQTGPMGGVPQMSNMQNQMIQVIAVPAGAAPPEGAIPIGQAPAGAIQDQMVQMMPMSIPESTSEEAPFNSPPQASSRAFKIKDPRTGQEVRPLTSDETAAASRRRMRIVNPKTGEEVRPNL